MIKLSKTFWNLRGARNAALLAAGIAAASGASAQSDADRAYCEKQEGPAKIACVRDLKSDAADGSSKGAAGSKAALAEPAAPPTGVAPYKVADGYKVDPGTLKGFQTWRQAACDRCHGPNQEGLVGPSLINSLKVLTYPEFVTTLTNGRLEKGMPAWSANKNVMDNIEHLYAYLKGRSDGAITKAHVEAMQ